MNTDKILTMSRIGTIIEIAYLSCFLGGIALVVVIVGSSQIQMEQQREQQAIYDAQPHDGMSYYAVDPVLMKNGHECNLGNGITAILPKNKSCSDSTVLVEGTNKIDTMSYYKTDGNDNVKPSISLTEAYNVRAK